MMEPRAEIKK